MDRPYIWRILFASVRIHLLRLATAINSQKRTLKLIYTKSSNFNTNSDNNNNSNNNNNNNNNDNKDMNVEKKDTLTLKAQLEEVCMCSVD